MIRIAALVILTASPALAEPGGLDVVVSDIRSAKGEIRVAVCDKANFTKPVCPYRGRAPAAPGTVTVHVAGIPPGTYAAEAFQDETGSGKIERNFFGLPKEGIGFSRDAPMRFGPPSFEDAMFSLDKSGGRIALALRYFQ